MVLNFARTFGSFLVQELLFRYEYIWEAKMIWTYLIDMAAGDGQVRCLLFCHTDNDSDLSQLNHINPYTSHIHHADRFWKVFTSIWMCNKAPQQTFRLWSLIAKVFYASSSLWQFTDRHAIQIHVYFTLLIPVSYTHLTLPTKRIV